MNSKTKLSVLIPALLLSLALYSYGSFSNFKPKSLVPVREVKGVKVEEDERIKLPFPENYKIIGRNIKDGNEHITYQTSQTPKNIQTFYRNIMISKDWTMESTSKAGIFTTTKYESANKGVSVTTSSQPIDEQTGKEVTIVILLLSN